MTWRWILVMTVTWSVASPDPRFNMNMDVTASPATLGDKDLYRLPVGPRPSHYQLYLAYDIDPAQEFPFYGLVKIQLSSNISTSEIVLHAEGFTTVNDEVTLTDESGKKLLIDGVSKKPDFNFLIIRLKEALNPGSTYELVIPFWGNLKPALEGAYISSYDDAMTGKKEHLVATQFEAIAARKAFPCFDEPDMKATFAIHLAHHKDYVAISNMPVSNHTKENLMSPYWTWDTMAKRFGDESSAISDSWVWDAFSESVPMSTYLVAWVISKFGHITSPPGLSHVNFRIWARKDALTQAEYASVIGPKVLSFYEDWFNVSFPLPKQDMIAIPDFSAGAMENWGLVTYRETALLYDPGRSSQINKERVAEVVAHELAHQWFGNLVTMEWWTDLWLNEGFATYMAILGVDAVEPSWDTTVSAIVDNTRNVLALDALKSSHPISVTVHDPKMIDEIFDAISYSKGCALIYMMNKFLSEDIFKMGINRYLMSHSYKNADQSKLWSALSTAAEGSVKLPKGKSVRDIMDTWTLQSGYPLLQVKRDYNSKTLKVEQHRFLSLNHTDNIENKEAWWVPLSILSEADIGQPAKTLSWLAPTEGIQEGKQFEHDAAESQWIVFNVDMIAPLRVTYDDKNWKLLIDTLVDSKKYKQIPVLSRVQLLDDAFALAKVSRLPYETTLRLASYLKHETEYEPLDTGLSVLGYILRLLSRDPDYGVVRTFLRELITPQFEAVGGLSAKPRGNKELKMQVLTAGTACRVGAGDCEEAALKMLEQWMENPNKTNPIPQDLRSVVYCTAIRRGGANHWDFLNQQRIKSNLATEQVSLLRALSCSRQVWILRRYLEWALTGQESIRSQDAASVISGITSNPEGFSIARDFVFERIEELHERFSGQKRRIGGVISSVLRHFTTQKELDRFLNWQKENAKYLDESKLAVQQAIESARINIDWTSRFKNSVVQIMKELES